ncbi:MAG: quinol:electron acceptor oxidoreductase subunit ActD [Acidobacteriota bacterium]
MYLFAEFHEKAQLTAAIRALKDAGAKDDDLDLFSEEPVELRRGVLDRPSKMSLVSVIGAVVLGTAVTSFVYFAQNNYKLITGGMPTFSFWATGVISFEMTMLGGVAATFGWFLWESGLLRKRDAATPVPLVAPGAISLRVRCASERAAYVSDVMYRAGADSIELKAA